MTDIRLFLDTRRESGDPTPPYAVLHDDHIRAIVERALQLGCFDWISRHHHGTGTLSADWPTTFTYIPSKDPCSFGTIQPAAHADDEATVRAMFDAMPNGGFVQSGLHKVLDAIRRGEVPGLPSPDEHAALKVEVERLRAALASEKERADINLAEANRRGEEINLLRAELNKAMLNHAGYIVERDAAIARAESAERKLRDAYTQIREDPIDTNKVIEDLSNAVDTARAAHAEAMEWLQDAVNGNMWEVDIRKHLAKHQNKDASK